MLVTSSFGYSQSIPMGQLSNIMQAIKDSLLIKDLDCHEVVNNLNFKASTLEWSALNGLAISINEKQQPAIEIHRIAFKESDAKFLDTTIKITTNSDHTIVEEISGSQYEIVTIAKQNIGTIINPIYKNISIKGKLYQQIECK